MISLRKRSDSETKNVFESYIALPKSVQDMPKSSDRSSKGEPRTKS